MSSPTQAFVLGAGLGTRLRPLTAARPKPLVPVWNEPLIRHAFRHLADVGVAEFIVNTHWCPEAYETAFPDSACAGRPIRLVHEPVLLETAGGLANIAPHLRRDRSFWVYNGDILSTLNLTPALAAHEASEAVVTLILRSQGPDRVIAFEESSSRVLDVRGLAGTGLAGTHQFTGLYLCRPEFLDWLTPGKIESTRTTFIDLLKAGRPVGGVVCDDGEWLDLGDRDSYLAAHRILPAVPPAADAFLGPQISLTGATAIGAGAEIGAGAQLHDCVIWPGGRVAPGARLRRCVVRDGQTASGEAEGRDF